jgi:hypothetical protein
MPSPCGRRREHPMDASKGDLRSLRVLRNFRLRIPKETPKGSSDLWSHPVLLLKKKRGGKAGHAHNLLPVRDTSRQGLFRSRDVVTSGQKAPLGRIWRNFRLHLRRIYFRTGSLPVMLLTSLPVTWLPVMSLPVTSLPVAPHSSPSNNNLSVPIYYSHGRRGYSNKFSQRRWCELKKYWTVLFRCYNSTFKS